MDTNNWTQYMAGLIRSAVQADGLDGISVYAEVEPEHVQGNCIRVVTQSVDDIIPGNYTYDCRGVVEVRLSSVTAADELRVRLGRVMESVQRALRGIRSMDEPNGPGEAPQVAYFNHALNTASTDNPYYVYGVDWRAVLQY